MGGNRGPKTTLRARRVVLGGADGRQAVPGVKRILRGPRSAFAGRDGHVESQQAVADPGRFLCGGEQRPRVPEIAGLSRGLVMRGRSGEITGSEIALRQRERMIGEGDARGEVEQWQGQR